MSGSGPAERNCDELSSRNGFTFRSQALGSLTKPGSTGSQTPGPGGSSGKPAGPKRPSAVRAAIIAAAAASPTAMPRVLGTPSAMPASDAAYWASSVDFTAPGRLRRTRYAAVAAAASFESNGEPTRVVSR